MTKTTTTARVRHIFDGIVTPREVVRVSATSFDYRDDDAGIIYRVHDAFDADRVYSDAIAVSVRPVAR
jgi:hypothetical protein